MPHFNYVANSALVFTPNGHPVGGRPCDEGSILSDMDKMAQELVRLFRLLFLLESD